LNYRSLQNIIPLVCTAAYFAAVSLDTASKLKVMAGYVLKAAKRLFGIPEFHYYCIADGLTSIFTRYPGRIIRLFPAAPTQGIPFPSAHKKILGELLDQLKRDSQEGKNIPVIIPLRLEEKYK